ncbi:hypothetical protein KEM54_003086 [Ascosphaera aggregata]|nr:hypothetical protein KEM54_003086 [Ascosphaera aggregata]
MAEKILMNEFKLLRKEKWAKLFEDDIFRWNIALMVLNPDSLYHGGYFRSLMTFPKNYPYSPPQFRFIRSIFHPNVYSDGRLCISILHSPGDDHTSGEHPSERWSPAQRVESVLVSILSLLDDAEVSSPANVDAGVLLRNDKKAYAERVRQDVELSKKDIPPGFVMPTVVATSGTGKEKKDVIEMDDEDFWADSADEADSDLFMESDSEVEYDEDTPGSNQDEKEDEEEEDDDDDDDDDKEEEDEGQEEKEREREKKR